jgi:hypothetical protein
MKNLKILFACGSCGIDKNGIKGLYFIVLNDFRNKKLKI